MNHIKFLYYSSGIGFLLIGLSIGYYYGIFLPSESKRKQLIVDEAIKAGFLYAENNLAGKNPKICSDRFTGDYEKGCLKYLTESGNTK